MDLETWIPKVDILLLALELDFQGFWVLECNTKSILSFHYSRNGLLRNTCPIKVCKRDQRVEFVFGTKMFDFHIRILN